MSVTVVKIGHSTPPGCAVFPVSAEANVYLDAKDRIDDAGKETQRFSAKLNAANKEREDFQSVLTELSTVPEKDVEEADAFSEDSEERCRGEIEGVPRDGRDV